MPSTWNYSGDPSTSDLDAVRFLIGDTDQTDRLLLDSEINWAISQEGSLYAAAARAANAIAAKFSREADKWVGDLKIVASQRSKQYENLAKSLSQRGMLSVASASFGGGSVSGKIAEEERSDRLAPSFWRGQFDHPGNPQAGGRASSDSFEDD